MESTLATTLDELNAEVGVFLGWGQGAPFGDQAWSSYQAARIKSFVKAGIHQVYFPPPDANGEVYEWSFLRPTTTVTLANAATVIPLPDDFGGIEGKVMILSPAQFLAAISVTGEGVVQEQAARFQSSTGAPQMVAVQPLRGVRQDRGQRFQLIVWPTADQAYTLELQYHILPNFLDGTCPYTYGGAAHAQTFVESCLAMAEQRGDDMAGVHRALFMERLAASIAQDKKNKPQKLGYNADRSDGLTNRGRWPWRDDAYTVTYNGVTYG